MKRVLCLLLCYPISLVFGQTMTSQLKDAKTLAPIQYATIGIVGKNSGTISDAEGHFRLSISNVSNSDSIRISMIGYVSKTYGIDALKNDGFPEVIFLEEKINELSEVTVTKAVAFHWGLKKKHGYPIPLYKGAESKVAFPQAGLRHEVGTRFSNSKSVSIDSIRLNFAECHVAQLNLRLNIYAVQEDSTMVNVLHCPIYLSLGKTRALNSPVINVIEQQLELDGDFLVTIENYLQQANGATYLFANFKKRAKRYPTYYRNGNQSHWQILKSKKDKPIAVSIEVFGH